MALVLKQFQKLLVLAVAVLVAFLPLAAAHLALKDTAREQGEQLVTSIAATMISRADRNITRAIGMLSELALLGVSSCRPDDIRVIRQTIQAQVWVNEIGILDPNGMILCNQFGEAKELGDFSLGAYSDSENVAIHVLHGNQPHETRTMLAWSLASGNSIVALMPGEAIADDVIPEDMRGKGVALVSLNDGTLVYMAPAQGSARAALPFDDSTFTANLESTRYPYRVAVLAPYDVIWSNFMGLYTTSMFIAGVLGIFICGLGIYAARPRSGRVNEIEAAIENGEFIPYYQPTINIRTGELLGCEVLIRWRKPDGQILPPGAFIGLAEATGLAIPMTRSLMANIVDEIEDLYERRKDLKIGINLFDDHFESLDIVEDIKEIFGPSKIRYKQLMFEVTERQPLTDIDRARIVIRNMRSLGCQVALDDAGTGHGGLAYLQQLGMDVIKIDKLFIDAIGTDSFSAPIVDSLISLADGLGMEVVAEGVEEPRQVEYLKKKGVKAAQGYLFAKPLPGDKYKRLIEKMVPTNKKPEERRRAQLKRRARKIAA